MLKHLWVDKIHIERIEVDVVHWRRGETSKHTIHSFHFRLSLAWQNLQFQKQVSTLTAP